MKTSDTSEDDAAEIHMRSLYGVSLQQQQIFLSGRGSEVSVIESTLEGVHSIHESVRICLGHREFSAALVGLMYADDLLKGESARCAVTSSSKIDCMWLDAAALRLNVSDKPRASNSYVALLQHAKSNQMNLLLDFEKKRVSKIYHRLPSAPHAAAAAGRVRPTSDSPPRVPITNPHPPTSDIHNANTRPPLRVSSRSAASLITEAEEQTQRKDVISPRGDTSRRRRLSIGATAALPSLSPVDTTLTRASRAVFRARSSVLQAKEVLSAGRRRTSLRPSSTRNSHLKSPKDTKLLSGNNLSSNSEVLQPPPSPIQISPIDHPLFDLWMARRRAFERGRYAEDISEPKLAIAPSKAHTAPSASSAAVVVEAPPTSGSLVSHQVSPSQTAAAGDSSADVPQRNNLMSSEERAALFNAWTTVTPREPRPPLTMMQHILHHPAAQAIVEDLLQSENGVSLLQSSEAWHAASVIQRFVRRSTARGELQRRWLAKRVYVEDVLPKLDALETIIRSLRGCVARRKYALLRMRILHVIDQRVSLENDPLELECQSMAFSISRSRIKPANTSPTVLFHVPNNFPDERKAALRQVQQHIAARLIQRQLVAYQQLAWREHLAELETLLRVVTGQPNRDSVPMTSPDPAVSSSDIPAIMRESVDDVKLSAPGSRTQSNAGSRRGSHHQFLPLKGVKLSALEALQRERAEAERLRQQKLEQIMLERAIRQREVLQRRTQAVMLMQRVCRAYRRRLFLFAKKLAQGGGSGGRVSISANPFLRSVTSRHTQSYVPHEVHSEILRLISQRNPHLIPEIRKEMDKRRALNIVVVQRMARAAQSLLLSTAILRIISSRRIQRWWRMMCPRKDTH